MELSGQEKALVNDLINIAWQAGAVKSPQMGMLLEQLRQKLQQTQINGAPVNGNRVLVEAEKG